MLIIGHRGAAGLAPENTLEALRAGQAAGADILEFDVRLTKDGIAVLSHDYHLLRTNHKPSLVSRLTFSELERQTNHHVTTLESVLDEFFGRIILNIEIKSRKTGEVVAGMIRDRYIKRPSDWHYVLFSSFKGLELAHIRRISPHAQLALLHQSENPFTFVAYSRKLRLSAIGLHRHYVNPFIIEIAHRSGMLVYVYTINRPQVATLLAAQGVDGIVTDHPDRMQVVNETASSRPGA